MSNAIIVRQGRSGSIRSLPVAAATRLHEGNFAFVDTNGNATHDFVDASTRFAGVVTEAVNNTAGAAGDRHCELITDGDFTIDVAELGAGSTGADIHAVSSLGATTDGTGRPKIGSLVKAVSSARAVVSIRGLGA